MDICLACVPASVAVGIGFVLYKVTPEVIAKIRDIFGNYFYKTIYITISQNKIKFVNLLKFMSNFKTERDCKAVLITIDDVEYEVPLLEIKITSTTTSVPEFSMKAHTDNNFNLTYIEISVWKRDLMTINEKKIEQVDGYLKKFPSSAKQQLEPPKQTALFDPSKPPTRRSLVDEKKKPSLLGPPPNREDSIPPPVSLRRPNSDRRVGPTGLTLPSPRQRTVQNKKEHEKIDLLALGGMDPKKYYGQDLTLRKSSSTSTNRNGEKVTFQERMKQFNEKGNELKLLKTPAPSPELPKKTNDIGYE